MDGELDPFVNGCGQVAPVKGIKRFKSTISIRMNHPLTAEEAKQ